MSIPTLHEARRIAMDHALNVTFPGGQRNGQARDPSDFRTLRSEAEFAAWAAHEFTDPTGPFARDRRLIEAAAAALERVAEDYAIGKTGDKNAQSPEPYFILSSATFALRNLADVMDRLRFTSLLQKYMDLEEFAAAVINRTHDYLNPRAMEAAACLSLHRLTDDRKYLQRCSLCLDELVARQYPCGALPYHTGGWVWGRRPAQVYQLLCAAMMLYAGRELNRDDVVESVQRVMDYEVSTTTHLGKQFVTPFEGLHKAKSWSTAPWIWTIGTSLGVERFDDLAWAAFVHWCDHTIEPLRGSRTPTNHASYLGGLTTAALLDVHEVRPARRFVPPGGITTFPDISTAVVHEGRLDLCLTVLTGYSAFAEADCGNVKLLALIPELTDRPTYRNAGTDALRQQWREPSEQLACSVSEEDVLQLRGRVFTKWITTDGRDADPKTHAHTRELEVALEYADHALVLAYQTIRNRRPEPLPSRLLLLMYTRPRDVPPRVTLDGTELHPPPADDPGPFHAEAPPGPVQVTAPDGSFIRIVPETCDAERIIVEKPGNETRPRPSKPHVRDRVRPANEGSLRIAFEGPNVLEKGAYRIEFSPKKSHTGGA